MNVAVQRRMTVTEFLAWAEKQPKGKYELVDGQVIAMSPERNRHVVVVQTLVGVGACRR